MTDEEKRERDAMRGRNQWRQQYIRVVLGHVSTGEIIL